MLINYTLLQVFLLLIYYKIKFKVPIRSVHIFYYSNKSCQCVLYFLFLCCENARSAIYKINIVYNKLIVYVKTVQKWLKFREKEKNCGHKSKFDLPAHFKNDVLKSFVDISNSR